MNVEGGTMSGVSLGSAVSTGPAVGSAVNVATSIGRFAPSFVNEGPVAPDFLANTMPLTLNKFNPIGEIIFNPATSVLNQAEEVAATAWEASLASQGLAWEATRVSEVSWTRPAPNPARGLDVRVITNPFLAPKEESAPQSIVQTRAESRITSAVARATSTLTQKEVQAVQVVEERRVVDQDKKEDKPQEKRSEKQSVAKIKIVEAVRVTQLRRRAISEAVRRVKEEAEKRGEKVVITGKKLKKFLSAEFWKYISPLVGRRGYDGTIPLTLKAIENNPTEYTNLEQAQTGLSQPVAEHIPLQEGERGRLATVEEVREVFEGKEKEAIKSQAPAEIVVIRLGQAVGAVVEEKEEVINEPTLKSLGLEEVFPKAA